MGAGILSIALSLDGQETLSRVVLVIAVIIWASLVLLLPLRTARDPAGFMVDARTPAALTAAVATAVLGTRLTLLGWSWAGVTGLVVAGILWLALLRPVLSGWKSPTVGVSLLLAVSTEALAVLAATLAAIEGARWLLIAALVPLVLGLVFYGFVISHFDFRQLSIGGGDHWITGGALAISTLAAAKITTGSKVLAILGGGDGVLKDLTIGLWILAMAWFVVLLFAEARWPRLGYDTRRWSTVFPLGMYAACSFVVGAIADSGAITSFARVMVWVALAFGVIVFVATTKRAVNAVRRSRATDPSVPVATNEVFDQGA
jgi:Voltage-dependent anion channel